MNRIQELHSFREPYLDPKATPQEVEQAIHGGIKKFSRYYPNHETYDITIIGITYYDNHYMDVHRWLVTYEGYDENLKAYLDRNTAGGPKTNGTYYDRIYSPGQEPPLIFNLTPLDIERMSNG